MGQPSRGGPPTAGVEVVHEIWTYGHHRTQRTGNTNCCLTVGPHTACVRVLTNAVGPAFFLVPLMCTLAAHAPPPPPPLLLSVITTTPLAAFQCCHHSQGFRQITSESDPLKSITALWRVLRERERCYRCRLFQVLIDPNLCSSKQLPALLWDRQNIDNSQELLFHFKHTGMLCIPACGCEGCFNRLQNVHLVFDQSRNKVGLRELSGGLTSVKIVLLGDDLSPVLGTLSRELLGLVQAADGERLDVFLEGFLAHLLHRLLHGAEESLHTALQVVGRLL